MGHVSDLATSKTKSPQNTSKTLLKSFLEHKKQKINFRFFSPHTLYMDLHLSSTPSPEPLGHMPWYYRRHNHYLIAILGKKNQTKLIYPRGKSAAHKTSRFRPYLIHGTCNGFADLENQKSPKHVQNHFKIVFKLLETKKKFSIFLPHTLNISHVTDLATSNNKSRQNTSKTLLKSFLEHKKQKKNFRFFSPHTLYMEHHLSSTPTPAPLGHMPPYYRRHNSYLIAIRCKKNNLDIMCLRGKSAAQKTCSFSPIPYTWDM